MFRHLNAPYWWISKSCSSLRIIIGQLGVYLVISSLYGSRCHLRKLGRCGLSPYEQGSGARWLILICCRFLQQMLFHSTQSRVSENRTFFSGGFTSTSPLYRTYSFCFSVLAAFYFPLVDMFTLPVLVCLCKTARTHTVPWQFFSRAGYFCPVCGWVLCGCQADRGMQKEGEN